MNYRTDLAIESKEMIEEKHKGKKVGTPGLKWTKINTDTELRSSG